MDEREVFEAISDSELLAEVERRGLEVPALGSVAIKSEVAEIEDLTIPEYWASVEYDLLTTAWSKYGIEIPAQTELQEKLFKARTTIRELIEAMPELEFKLGVLLVPPTKLTGWPIKQSLCKTQGIRDTNDFVNPNLPKPETDKNWRLLVTDTSESGVHLSSPNKIFIDRAYEIGQYDTRALGLTEYAALSLQAGEPIDKTTNTWLLKGFIGGRGAPGAAFLDGGFNFDLSNADIVYDNFRFRPAVEVK